MTGTNTPARTGEVARPQVLQIRWRQGVACSDLIDIVAGGPLRNRPRDSTACQNGPIQKLGHCLRR